MVATGGGVGAGDAVAGGGDAVIAGAGAGTDVGAGGGVCVGVDAGAGVDSESGGSEGNDGSAVCDGSGVALESGGNDCGESVPDEAATPEGVDEPKPLQPVTTASSATVAQHARYGRRVIETTDNTAPKCMQY